jgi:hypothetical protein
MRAFLQSEPGKLVRGAAAVKNTRRATERTETPEKTEKDGGCAVQSLTVFSVVSVLSVLLTSR